MNYDNYNRALKKVKFSADESDVAALIKAHLDNPDEGTTKMALTDALMERDRHQEASLLQSGHPYYHWNGNFYQHDPYATEQTLNHVANGYLDAATEGSGRLRSLIAPETRAKMVADAHHFYQSHGAVARAGTLHPYDLGVLFFNHRNNSADSQSLYSSPNYQNNRVAQFAFAAGPYTLEQGKDGLYHGKGGDHHWGQQPG